MKEKTEVLASFDEGQGVSDDLENEEQDDEFLQSKDDKQTELTGNVTKVNNLVILISDGFRLQPPS